MPEELSFLLNLTHQKIILILSLFSPKNKFYPFIVLLALLYTAVLGKENDLGNYRVRLTPVTINEGLSQGYIPCIIQDKRGYMWFTTKDGLNRYDGYKFNIYRHDAVDTTTISDNYTENIFEDSRGLFWIKTVSFNLDVLNPQREIFYHLPAPAERAFYGARYFSEDAWGNVWYKSEVGLFKVKVLSGLEEQKFSFRASHAVDKDDAFLPTFFNDADYFSFDSHKNLWLLYGDSIYIASKDAQQNKEKVKSFSQADFCGVANDKIFHFVEDTIRHTVFFISSEGIAVYNTASNKIEKFAAMKIAEVPYRQACNIDGEGNFWFLTENGLMIYNKTSNEIKKITPLNVDFNTWAVMGLKSVYCDRGGTVWIGTNGYSLFKYNPRAEKFHHVATLPGLLLSVTGFTELNDGNTVVFSNGRLLFNRTEQKIEKKIFAQDPFIIQPGHNPNYFADFLQDKNDSYWFAFPGGDLMRFDAKQNSKKTFRNQSARDLNTMVITWTDNSNKIWLSGEHGFQAYIYSFDPQTEKFTEPVPFPEKVVSHGYPFISKVLVDNSGIFWIATTQGLFEFNPGTYQWTTIKNIAGNKNSLSNNIVFSLCLDPVHPSDYLWIGTNSGGLCRLEMKTGTFINYTDKDGLPNNVIYGILSDNSGNLWLSTNKGLCRFSIETKAYKNYYSSDGLQSNEFNRYAYHKAKNGELYFGGVNGFNFFNPDELKANTNPPLISFTGFRLFNRNVSFSDSASPVHMPLDYADKVVLKPKQNVFTFQFAALDFSAPEKNQFRYRMDGFDEDWITCGSQHDATYTNLNPGEYTFHVQAANSEGVWNETGKSIAVVVLPPWWQTWWATLLAIILVATAVFLTVRIRTNKSNQQRAILEQRVQERTADLLMAKVQAESAMRQAESAKQTERQFLANMSHEIRTPMNAIIGMSNLALKTDLNALQMKYLTGIKTSSQNLLVIINDILDITKIDEGKMDFETIEFSLDDVIDTVHTTLHFKAEEKALIIKENIDPNIPKLLLGDPVRLGQVLINIAGNAIKFTEKGQIEIHCRLATIDDNNASIEFSIADTGIGIPQDKLEKVFESFSQASTDTTRKYGGTGLGLSISKQLVELQGGTIKVRSTVGVGTTFSFTLTYHHLAVSQTAKQKENTEEYYAAKLSDIRVLLVDDNSFNQIVASDTLEELIKGVKVDTAENGKIAVEKVEANDYDIILMDIQMPEMDGLQATRLIRGMEASKGKVPIMAMTAAASKIEIAKCFDVGMNEYISKPFQPLALLEKMAGILKNGSRNSINWQR
jgi:signal transduction histidine kinase/ligand-binding sensor domain-containing protein/ActR/RegA family two-component response regulator